MPSVERTVGVGGDELDVDPLALPEVEPGVALLPASEHVGEDLVQPGLAQVEVHEARPGDLDPLDVGRRRGVQPLDQLAGQLPGHPAGLLGRGHGDVGGPVAVLPAPRPLQVDRVRRVDADLHQGVSQGASQRVADHGWATTKGGIGASYGAVG